MKTFYICLITFLGTTLAQTPASLFGKWQTQDGNVLMHLSEDGTYFFQILSDFYNETGTWQLDGTTFSQQWEDYSTGEVIEESYRLEFLSETSFVMSEGNFSEPLTFTKVLDDTVASGELEAPSTTSSSSATILTPTSSAPVSSSPASTPAPTLLLEQLYNKDAGLQLPPPEAGDYNCTSTNLTANITFDPAGSFGSTMLQYGINTSDSLLGTLTLNSDGTYRMINGESGTYRFDVATNQVSFTGFLEPLPSDYFVEDGWFSIRFNFTDNDGNEVASVSCAHASARAVTATTSTPNPGLPGTFFLHLDGDDLASFVAETGEVRILGEASEPHQAANGEIISTSSSETPEFVILAQDGTTIQLAANDGGEIEEGMSVEDIFSIGFSGTPTPSEPVLSADGSLIAYSSVDGLGTQNVIVRRRTGAQSEVIVIIPNMMNPTWTNDGRLIMAGGTHEVEGLYLADAAFTTLTRLDPKLAKPSVPSLSPDGQSVVFLQGGQLWLMNVDGSQARPYANMPGLDVFGYPTWSPDGQWLAVAAAEQGFEMWSWILVLSADGNLEKAQRLNLPDTSPLNVNRNSRIAWY